MFYTAGGEVRSQWWERQRPWQRGVLFGPENVRPWCAIPRSGTRACHVEVGEAAPVRRRGEKQVPQVNKRRVTRSNEQARGTRRGRVCRWSGGSRRNIMERRVIMRKAQHTGAVTLYGNKGHVERREFMRWGGEGVVSVPARTQSLTMQQWCQRPSRQRETCLRRVVVVTRVQKAQKAVSPVRQVRVFVAGVLPRRPTSA